jgi:hypothetical protein
VRSDPQLFNSDKSIYSQRSVDDVLDLVHDVVLGEEVALVPATSRSSAILGTGTRLVPFRIHMPGRIQPLTVKILPNSLFMKTHRGPTRMCNLFGKTMQE